MATTAVPARWGAPDDWRPLARCRDHDTNFFFPIGVTGPAIEHIAAAKAVCGECPVQAECLEFALDSNQQYGVWGGASEEERLVMRRDRRRAARAAAAAAS